VSLLATLSELVITLRDCRRRRFDCIRAGEKALARRDRSREQQACERAQAYGESCFLLPIHLHFMERTNVRRNLVSLRGPLWRWGIHDHRSLPPQFDASRREEWSVSLMRIFKQGLRTFGRLTRNKRFSGQQLARTRRSLRRRALNPAYNDIPLNAEEIAGLALWPEVLILREDHERFANLADIESIDPLEPLGVLG
jgi:hypothetical protein